MTAGVSRMHFNSAELVRVLADVVGIDGQAAQGGLVERLGAWLGVAEAIPLFSALGQGGTALSPSRAAGPRVAWEEAVASMAQVKSALAMALAPETSREGGRGRLRLPMPSADLPFEVAADYVPFQRYYQAHQRALEGQVAALRARVRSLMMPVCERLQGLVAVDAALEKAFAAREQQLLANVPGLLGRRFEQWRTVHLDTRQDDDAEDSPEAWMQPGGWLARFCAEMHTVLRAEMELRLLPVQGLIDAFAQEVARSHE